MSTFLCARARLHLVLAYILRRPEKLKVFKNLYGELAMAVHIPQESPKKFQSFPTILGRGPSVLSFGQKYKGNQPFLDPFFTKYLILAITF